MWTRFSDLFLFSVIDFLRTTDKYILYTMKLLYIWSEERHDDTNSFFQEKIQLINELETSLQQGFKKKLNLFCN
jgi:hypothetical protein